MATYQPLTDLYGSLESATPKTDAALKAVQARTPGASLTAAQPAPISPGITPARTALQQSVSKDLEQGQRALATAGQQIGMQAPTQQFQERGIKIGNQIVAKDELSRALAAQDKAVKAYATTAGFQDQASIDMATQQMNDRLNKIRLELVRRGEAFNAKLKQQQLSDEERRRAAQMWGQVAGTIAGGVIGGALGGGPMGAIAGAGVGGSLGGAVSQGLGGIF